MRPQVAQQHLHRVSCVQRTPENSAPGARADMGLTETGTRQISPKAGMGFKQQSWNSDFKKKLDQSRDWIILCTSHLLQSSVHSDRKSVNWELHCVPWRREQVEDYVRSETWKLSVSHLQWDSRGYYSDRTRIGCFPQKSNRKLNSSC